MNLEERIEAIEARQRDYGMHDPDCPTRQVEHAQRNSMMYFVRPDCRCWLAEDWQR